MCDFHDRETMEERLGETRQEHLRGDPEPKYECPVCKEPIEPVEGEDQAGRAGLQCSVCDFQCADVKTLYRYYNEELTWSG